MIPTTFPGEPEERQYRVVVFIDGLPFFSKTVDARSNEEAAAVAFFIAVIGWIGREIVSGPPGPPDGTDHSDPAQTSYLT